jgi:mRNA interferase MazF
MRDIHLARMDMTRPVLVLTRGAAVGIRRDVTVAGITSRVLGVDTEVPVGQRNGVDRDCVVNLDNVQTIPHDDLGRPLGHLFDDQEPALLAALLLAFDFDMDDLDG